MLLVRLGLKLEVIREMSDGKGQQTFPNRFRHFGRLHRLHRVTQHMESTAWINARM